MEGFKRISIEQGKAQRLAEFRRIHQPTPEEAEVPRVITRRSTLISEGGNIVGDAYKSPTEATVWTKQPSGQLSKNERNLRPILDLKELKSDQRAAVKAAEQILSSR